MAGKLPQVDKWLSRAGLIRRAGAITLTAAALGVDDDLINGSIAIFYNPRLSSIPGTLAYMISTRYHTIKNHLNVYMRLL